MCNMNTDNVKEQIARALAPALADLHASTLTAPTIEWRIWADPPMLSCVLRNSGGDAIGFSIRGDVESSEQIRDAASQLQDWVIDGGQTSTWPVCSLHPASHPLEPDIELDVASWICPKDRSFQRPIGKLIGG